MLTVATLRLVEGLIQVKALGTDTRQRHDVSRWRYSN